MRGTVSMARANDPNSGDSQFFICFDDAGFLDNQYTVWGKVIEGMENVDKIKRGEPVSNPDKMYRKGDDGGVKARHSRIVRAATGLPKQKTGTETGSGFCAARAPRTNDFACAPTYSTLTCLLIALPCGLRARGTPARLFGREAGGSALSWKIESFATFRICCNGVIVSSSTTAG